MCMAMWLNEMNKLHINMVKMDIEFPLGSNHTMAFYSHVDGWICVVTTSVIVAQISSNNISFLVHQVFKMQHCKCSAWGRKKKNPAPIS